MIEIQTELGTDNVLRIKSDVPRHVAELITWIRKHYHHAHWDPVREQIVIGIDAFADSGNGDGTRIPFTAIERVRSYEQARDALGY